MRRTAILWVVATAAIWSGVAGCDSEKFDDADYARASAESGDSAESAGDGDGTGEETPPGSAGPIQGSERPPDHPTIQEQGGGSGGGQPGGGAPAPNVDRPEPESYGESGPIHWEAPDDWQPRSPSNSMRFAEYDIPGREGDSAELTVFYFGRQGGGGVDQNLERWAGEFSGGSEPVRDRLEVDGMTVHTLEVDGTRRPSMPMGGGSEPVEDQKLMGAIAEASAGLFFFRLVGDRSVVAEQSEEFEAFVESLEDAR